MMKTNTARMVTIDNLSMKSLGRELVWMYKALHFGNVYCSNTPLYLATKNAQTKFFKGSSYKKLGGNLSTLGISKRKEYKEWILKKAEISISPEWTHNMLDVENNFLRVCKVIAEQFLVLTKFKKMIIFGFDNAKAIQNELYKNNVHCIEVSDLLNVSDGDYQILVPNAYFSSDIMIRHSDLLPSQVIPYQEVLKSVQIY